MAGLIDTIYTLRFLKIFSSKWENTDAFKLGIIDKDGTPLKKSKDFTTKAEKKAYTPFVRLIFKLKRLMGKLPGGKSAVARYGAAIALIKEHSEEVEKMGMDLKSLEEGLKRYINEDFGKGSSKSKFVNRMQGDLLPIGNRTLIYNSKDNKDLEDIIKYAGSFGMKIQKKGNKVHIRGESSSHKKLIDKLTKLNISGMVSEEVTTGVGGIEGKDQPLGKKGEVKKRKKKKEDEVVDKNNTNDDNKSESTSYSYQVIGDVLIRVDEIKKVTKKRIKAGKRSKKREYVPTKRRTRTGSRKLRGGKKAKWKRSHKKAYRKAKTGSAKAKRRRSMKKSRRYR